MVPTSTPTTPRSPHTHTVPHRSPCNGRAGRRLRGYGGVRLLVGLCAYLRLVWRTTGEAMKPVPSLAEIDAQLRAESYKPSIADCVVLHQYLTSQRNEAAFLSLGHELSARRFWRDRRRVSHFCEPLVPPAYGWSRCRPNFPQRLPTLQYPPCPSASRCRHPSSWPDTNPVHQPEVLQDVIHFGPVESGLDNKDR